MGIRTKADLFNSTNCIGLKIQKKKKPPKIKEKIKNELRRKGSLLSGWSLCDESFFILPTFIPFYYYQYIKDEIYTSTTPSLYNPIVS